ncbi:MAG: hypothetical protein PUJ62_13795 [Lachnospiraceae bacterium]|nr:hypothetical protein [Lachnospiraceae bacterium]
MKQRWKKLVSVLGTTVLAASMLAGCGGSSDGSSSASSGKSETVTSSSGEDASTSGGETAAAEPGSITYPLQTDVDSISWYAQEGITLHEKFKNASESPFHVGLAKNVGVTIDWSFPTTGADASTFTNTLLADPESLPNIMQGYFMENASQYIDDGIIWDLTDYIQQYAPDYYAFLQTNPAYDKAMKDDQGRYYTFGFFREDGGWNDSYEGPVVRKDWLDECGLEAPKTISEFENVIRVFNEKYGATFDASATRIIDMGICGAFGAYGSYQVNQNYGWYVKDGKVQLAAAQDEWRDYLSWLNKLWDEGLIDQDMMSEDDTTIKDKIHNDKCGITYTSMGQINLWNKEAEAAGKEAVWIGIPYPTADDGSLSCVFGGPGIGKHTTVITTTADEETLKVCMEVLNYAYTEEGMLYWNYGTEGESWEYDENGVPQFTSLVTDDPDTDPMTKYNGATWGSCCIQATNLLYQKNSQVAVEANDTWYYIYDDEAKNLEVTSGWRYPVGVSFTVEESDKLDEIAANIPTYVSENYAAFLTGSKDVDDDAVWEAYLNDLESYNLSAVLEVRQAAYDRYLER